MSADTIFHLEHSANTLTSCTRCRTVEVLGSHILLSFEDDIDPIAIDRRTVGEPYAPMKSEIARVGS